MTGSNLKLMIVPKKSCMDMECSICYKKINRTYFVCSTPCSKVFHTNCIEQMMEKTEEAAYEDDEDAEHKCCYCRRSINVRNYQIQLIARELIALKNMGYYDVSDAMRYLKRASEVTPLIDIYDAMEDSSYKIYVLRDNTYIKKPKQAKRALFKKTIQKQPRVHIKQNIGGRRRS